MHWPGRLWRSRQLSSGSHCLAWHRVPCWRNTSARRPASPMRAPGAAVIISVAVLRQIVPAAWLGADHGGQRVAGNGSSGLRQAGCCCGDQVCLRHRARPRGPCWSAAQAAVLAGGLGAAGSQLLSDVGILAAVLGACAVALLCVLVFTAMLRLLCTLGPVPDVGRCAVVRHRLRWVRREGGTTTDAGAPAASGDTSRASPQTGATWAPESGVFCPEATAEATGFRQARPRRWAADQPAAVHRRRSDTCPWTESGLAGTPDRLMYKVPLVVTFGTTRCWVTGSRQRQHARRFERWRWELDPHAGSTAAISWPWRRGWELGTYGSPRLRRQFCRKPR